MESGGPGGARRGVHEDSHVFEGATGKGSV